MIVTTADVIPGQAVQVLGLVRGNIVTSKNIGRDLMAGMKSIVGGEIVSYTQMTDEARQVAEDRMVTAAQSLGADAVVAMRFASDSIAEGLMRSVVENGRIAANDDQNYEARSNIMWAATWALNTLIAKGKPTDWMVHMLGQGVGAVTDATHGMTLSAVSLPYYRFIMDAGLPKFARFATHVWGINPVGKSERELAEAGLSAMEAWMRELGVAMNLAELGVTEADLDDVVSATFIMTGGYKTLTKEDVRNVLLQCL